MPHVDEGTLHALLDGALAAEDPARARDVEAHLDACEDCRARLTAAERVRSDSGEILAATLPDGATEPDFADVLTRAAGGGAVAGAAERLRRQARWTRGLAWAATIVIALGTGYLLRDLAEPTVRAGAATGPAGAVEQELPTEADPVMESEPGPAEPQPSAMDDGADAGAGDAAPSSAPPAPARAGGEGAAIERLEAERAASETADQQRRERETALPVAGAAEMEAAPQSFLSDAVPAEAWAAVTVEEAREALDGPLYVLPRAELEEIYLDEGRATARVLTLQRLATGVPVRVVQTRVQAPEGVAEPGAEGARVVRGPFLLELTGTIPAELLEILGGSARPAP